MASHRLKNGVRVTDPRLGRIPSFDRRSRGFNIADRLPAVALKSKLWPLKLRLDQGNTSACTGNARTYDLAASPKPLRGPDGKPFTEAFAQALYRLAQKYDEWPGEKYEGSSVLGALKAALALGYIGEYRFAFNVDDALAAISHLGPVVVGTSWLDSMFDPTPLRPSRGHGVCRRRAQLHRSRRRLGRPDRRGTQAGRPAGPHDPVVASAVGTERQRRRVHPR